MLVLLMRHAQAAAQDAEAFPDDTLRPLVPKGRRAQRRMSRQLVKAGLTPTRVFSSPWLRAWQTARVVVRETGIGKERRLPCAALAAPPDVDALRAEIGEISAEEIVGLVGHEPWMSGLAGLLLTGHDHIPPIDFAKSGVMGIELEKLEVGAGVLKFYWVP
jgi:phosphohistidine phosphatase